MVKKLLSVAMVAGLSLAALSGSADAAGFYRGGHGYGGYHGYHGYGGAGIAAGLLGGAIIGGAIANGYYADGPYYEDDTVICHRVRVRDDYGNIYFRRVCD